MPKVQGTNVDFALHTIGWKAFQDLSAHVCETALNKSIEVYREANDGGQDATFLIRDGSGGSASFGTVQCKHVSDPNRKMKPSDISEEVPKIRRLVREGQAETYIFMSNMSVDAPIAKEIRTALANLGVKNPIVWGKQTIVKEIRASARLRALVPQVYGLGDLSVIMDERAVEQTKVLLGHWLPKLRSYVATSSHNKAVRALEEYGVVLLLGNPSTGKSTIGAILSTIASEDCSHTVLQLSSPRDFEQHWNPHSKNSFYWLDDAFGPNVPRDDFIQDWCTIFPKVQTAIALGNRFLFTSRRHIYRASEKRLGNRNLDEFSSGKAIVDVGILSHEEKSQILYNHINFGTQSATWKTRAKPHLEDVANAKIFLPGIAERLGNPTFTKNLILNSPAMVRFMEEPQEHLIETIEELDAPMRAALILAFAFQGKLPSAVHSHETVQAVEEATGVKYADVVASLPALEGSFLRREGKANSESIWTFEHPTISDALTKILDDQPQMLAALLRGAKVEKVLSDFVCHGTSKIQDAVVVPQELSDVLIERLVQAPDQPLINRALFRFLADRADNEVFRKVVIRDPAILARGIYHSSETWLDPKFKTHARAASLGILPESCREETARFLEEAALDNFDLSFVEDAGLLHLIPPQKLFALGFKVRRLMEQDIETLVSQIGEDADLDNDAESNFETFNEGLRIVEEVSGIDPESDEVFSSVAESVDREIQNIEERQEEKRHEEEEEEHAQWMFAESHSALRPTAPPGNERSAIARSIFDDVDR